MAKIVVGFSRPKNMNGKFFAWAIMKGYGTPFSHTYIKIWSEKYQRNLYYQASGLAVNFMGDEYFLEHNEVVEEFTLEIPDETYRELMQFAIDKCGAPYGIKQIAFMAYVRAGELMGQRWSSPSSDEMHTFVCSELVSYILEKFVGVALPRLPDDMTPLDVYNLLRQLASTIDSGTSGQNA